MNRRSFLRSAAAGAATLSWALVGLPRAAAATRLFSDPFSRRSTSKGWGKPWFNQRYGMRWGISKRRGFYDLPVPYVAAPHVVGDPPGGAGLFNPNPVLVLDHDVADVDVSAIMSTSNANARFGLVARQVGYGESYAAYLDDGKLVISRFTLNREQVLGQARFRVDARKKYRMRFVVTGTGGVSLKAKAWRVGQKEPRSFTVTARHANANERIDKPGSFGFLFMHDGGTRRAVRFTVARFKAVSAQQKRSTPPRITYAYAGRIQQERTRVVAKADTPANIVFHVSDNERFKPFRSVEPDETHARSGVAKAWLPGPGVGGTLYWRAKAKSKSARNIVSVSKIRSLTVPGKDDRVGIAFGSCTKFYPVSKSFLQAARLRPALFAHLGDLGYAQHVEGAALALRRDAFQDRWTRMLARPSLTTLHLRSAWVMTQDDHDYGHDNAWWQTVKPFTVPAWDELSGNLNTRRFDVRLGEVHCFFVDTHVHADDPSAPDGPGHTLLGEAQKAELKQAMRDSTARLLILFTPMPFWGAGEGGATWKRAFAHEREELMRFFGGLQGPNRRVLICSGNAHAQFVARHTNPAGDRDILEFVSSGTDQAEDLIARPIVAGDGTMDPLRAIKNVNAFGYVELQPAGLTRNVIVRAINSDTGADVWPPLIVEL